MGFSTNHVTERAVFETLLFHFSNGYPHLNKPICIPEREKESILRCISAFGIKIIHNMDLDSLKYAELQRLAKEVGMKANMKVNRVY